MYKKGRVNSNSRIISTDEDPSLRIESSAIINLRGVSTKLNKYKINVVVFWERSSVVEHSTADREVGGSIPLALFLRILGRVKQPFCTFSGKSNMKNRAVFNW